MKLKTEDNQPNGQGSPVVDDFDRKILGEMVGDARQTYGDIGKSVGLSAPAVHERVKRLKAAGTITGTSAQVDAHAIGKPFLAFVHVNSKGWGKSERMMRLREYPEVEELHSVTGDTCVIMKVRTADAQAMEQFLAQIYALPGVQGTKSYVVLSTYVERPVQAEVTEEWPEIPLPPE